MNNYKYEEQSGRSMIEMLGVLAIIGVLSVGGIAGYSKAMNKFKTNKVADNVAMIVTNIRTLYAQQQNYNGLNNKTAVEMGVVPDELITATPTGDDDGLQNAFLGKVVIGAATVTGMDAGTDSGKERGFFLTMGGLPREACVTLATNDWGSGYSSGFVGMKITGKATTPPAPKKSVSSNNISQSGTALASATLTDANTSTAPSFAVGCTNATADNWCSKNKAMNVAVAAGGCSADGNGNSITWVYY